MNLQPRHHKGSPHTTRSPALSYASGTASSHLSMPHHQPARDPLDTDTDTPTDKENNND